MPLSTATTKEHPKRINAGAGQQPEDGHAHRRAGRGHDPRAGAQARRLTIFLTAESGRELVRRLQLHQDQT